MHQDYFSFCQNYRQLLHASDILCMQVDGQDSSFLRQHIDLLPVNLSHHRGKRPQWLLLLNASQFFRNRNIKEINVLKS